MIVVIAGTGGGFSSGAHAATSTGAWQVFPDAFPTGGGWRNGPHTLVADPAGCYLAVGEDTQARFVRPGYWQATGDCTRPVNVTPPAGPVGEVLPRDDRDSVVAAVAAHGGGYLLVTRHRYFGDAYAYDSAVVQGSPAQGWRRLAKFRTDTPRSSHIGPTALVAVPDGYVAVGNHDGTAVAWTSDDAASWREVTLPLPAEATAAGVTGVTAGPDGRLVAVGTSSGTGELRPVGWHSTDRGHTWQVTEMPRPGGFPQLWSVVHGAAGYVALGGVDGELRSAALVFTSPDGVHWQRDEAAAQAGARLITAAVATPDGTVYAVSGNGVNAPVENEQCATAWRFADGRVSGEDLQCHGIPTALAPLPDGRVAAVHWGALFLRAQLP